MRAFMSAAIALIPITAVLIATAAADAKPKPKPAHAPAHTSSRPSTGDGTQRPVDVGPFTPEANRAYQGGGVSLPASPRP